MTYARRTPAKIAKALVEETLDEEWEPYSKKLRRIMHKNKADEKKKINNPQLQLVMCHLKTKMIELLTRVLCAFYLPLLP